jgi:DNA invertase Pin-like site-specific DNA recombinase
MSSSAGGAATVKATRAKRRVSAAARLNVGATIELRSGSDWAIYVRQSKKRKNQRGEVTTISVSLQEQECRNVIARLDPEPRSITVITDHGRRGVRGHHRPGREELLTLVYAGEVNAVMAYKASRIGRDIEESENLWNRCRDRGVFVAAADCPNLDNPLIRGVYFGMAQQESVDRSNYSIASAQTRRDRGLPPNKTCPAYGMRWAGEELATDPLEFPVVERIFKLFDDGVGTSEIARRLTAEKAPRRGVGHTEWEYQAVHRILRTTWYVGLVPDGETFWKSGQTFIDIDLFERVKARVTIAEDTKQGFSRALSGLLYCGECGGWSPMSLYYTFKKRNDGTVHKPDRYRCMHRVRNKAFCSGQSIDSEAVELHLLAELRAVLGTDELSKARLERRVRQASSDREQSRFDHQVKIDELQAEQDHLFERRQGGEVIPDRIYNAQMTQLVTECELHEEKVELASGAGRMQAATLKRMGAELGADPLEPENWFTLAPTRRNEFLRLMFPDGITVTKEFNGKSNRVDNRLRPRTFEEHEESELRRNSPERV